MPKAMPAYLPVIAENDYVAFRKCMGDNIPATYAEWLAAHRRRLRDYGPGSELASGPIVEVEVMPDKFEAYCKQNNLAFDFSAMCRFVHP